MDLCWEYLEVFHMIHYHIRHEWYDTIPNEIEILRRYNKDNPGKRAVMEVKNDRFTL